MPSMGVLVVLVVRMQMFMLDRQVKVLMLMVLRQMQPDACSHEDCRKNKTSRQRIAQEQYGDRCAHERGGREVSAGAGASNVAQGQNKQRQADAVANEPNEACAHEDQRPGNFGSEQQPHSRVRGPRHQALEHRDLDWVTC